MIVGRLARLIRVVALTGTALACRDTNIVAPGGETGRGGVVLFASNRVDNNFEIYRMGADGQRLTRLTTAREFNDRAPVLSPDGSRIAWEREITTPAGDLVAVEIWTMDADGSDQRAVVRNGSFNRGPSWGPSGEIVFASRISGSDQIYRLAAGAAEPVRLSNSGAADQHPRVSPDGQRIVFQSNRGLDFDIYVMGVDGTGVVNLTHLPGDDRFPTWTPDGARIVWTRYETEANGFDLYSMRVDGGEPTVVVATAFNELAPSVSPDGRAVVYQTDRLPPFGLYVTTLADGEARPLRSVDAGGTGSDLGPWWGQGR